MFSHMVDLSVVILSWNVRDLLRQCLRSVAGDTGLITGSGPEPKAPYGLTAEVIVVDNASNDGSAEMVRAEFPFVRLILNETNRGYTGGNNDGIAVAGGRYVMILNPDALVMEDALATMVAYADAHPEVGVLGPQLLDPDGSVQSSRRRFPTLMTALFESTWLQPLAPCGVLRRYYLLDCADDETQEVDWLVGACLLVRRETIQQVGGLDEGFFMYSEELDWCRRIRQAGWKVVYLPKAQVIHHVGKSSDQVVAQRHIYFQTSKVRYFRKHHGALAAGGVRIVLLMMYAGQLVLEAVKGALGHKRALRRERVRAYWQVLRSGLRVCLKSSLAPRGRTGTRP
jgi:N-acetylglucosaminyl-diphospho-decaprenol L-rhamnosyltransferase